MQFPLLEDLASNGYVVIEINHPYFNRFSVLQNGSEITFEDNVLFPFNSNSVVFGTISPVLVEDQAFVLDSLASLNVDDELLAGRMDLTRIGAIGFTLGGTAWVQTAYERDDLLAVMNLEGLMDGPVMEEGLDVPVAMTRSAPYLPAHPEIDSRAAFILENAPVGYRLEVNDITGLGYNTALLIAAPQLDFDVTGIIGRMDPEAAREVIFNFTLAFVNTHVAGEGAAPTLADFDPGEVAIYEAFSE